MLTQTWLASLKYAKRISSVSPCLTNFISAGVQEDCGCYSRGHRFWRIPQQGKICVAVPQYKLINLYSGIDFVSVMFDLKCKKRVL